jgi:serine/threonine-protein kinase RsbW
MVDEQSLDPHEEGIRALVATNGDRRGARPRWIRRPAVRAGPACTTTYPSSAESVGAARRDVVRMARDAGASSDVLADIELAVSEASTNAVIHAYAPSGTRGETFTIAVATTDAQVRVWVTDEGQGRQPSAPSTGLGLGLEIMTRLSDRLVIGVLDDGRTQVEMRFPLH